MGSMGPAKSGSKARQREVPDAGRIASLTGIARIEALMIRANHMSHPLADRLDELSDMVTALWAEIEQLRRVPHDAEVAAMVARLEAALALDQDHAAGLLDLGHQVMVRQAASLLRRLSQAPGNRPAEPPHPACENAVSAIATARVLVKEKG